MSTCAATKTNKNNKIQQRIASSLVFNIQHFTTWRLVIKQTKQVYQGTRVMSMRPTPKKETSAACNRFIWWSWWFGKYFEESPQNWPSSWDPLISGLFSWTTEAIFFYFSCAGVQWTWPFWTGYLKVHRLLFKSTSQKIYRESVILS